MKEEIEKLIIEALIEQKSANKKIQRALELIKSLK